MKKIKKRKKNILINMTLLFKMILNICQNMPEDPVEELANFLLENRFNEVMEEKDKK